MLATLSTILGGIGLFLLGMILMTEGLKAVAGEALRAWLHRFTGHRGSAVLAGAGLTALVQSSSATTVATIGFVSAGLLSFQNSIGVIIGANIGTTSTGWIVALLGLKLSIGKVALPLIGIGALTRLLARDRLAQAGMALAGFGVIFVGIDVLQAGMVGLSALVDLSTYSAAGAGPRMLLVLAGIVMTVVMQSSSAAVATTLTALAGGTINVEQAAALVIGQNVGTTVTAGIAAIGASTAAKRTALVHVVFNVGTAAVAFILLPAFTSVVEYFQSRLAGADHAVTLAAFHTLFNLLGAAIFLPLTATLAAMAEWIVRERGTALTRDIDASQREVPALAIGSAHRALKRCTEQLFGSARLMLRGDDAAPSRILEVEHALTAIREFLGGVSPQAGAEFRRLLELLHVLDHLQQIAARELRAMPTITIRESAGLQPLADELARDLASARDRLDERDLAPDVARLAAMAGKLSEHGRAARPMILHATAERRLGLDAALAELSALRWMERIAYHAWRSVLHLQAVVQPDDSTPPGHGDPTEPPPDVAPGPASALP